MFTTRAPGPATSPGRSLLVMAMLGAMALPLPGRALDLPRAGVICDAAQRICYDLQGPSLAQTRREFGRRAEQELLRSISGRPPAREIRFSSGEICDLRRQICWDDGTRRENISRRLTHQLFRPAGNDGWQDPLNESRCQLRQGERRLFNGACNLSTTGDLGNRTYLVEMGDGRRYSFTNRSGRLQLRDATGTWPVTTIDRGETVVFRWADLQLEASRPPRYESGLGSSPAPDAYPSQPVLQQLIESLFR